MKRKTNYKDGQQLRLIDNDFNNWEIGVTVTVKTADNNQYHVRNNVTGDWIWVYEHQVEPI